MDKSALSHQSLSKYRKLDIPGRAGLGDSDGDDTRHESNSKHREEFGEVHLDKNWRLIEDMNSASINLS